MIINDGLGVRGVSFQGYFESVYIMFRVALCDVGCMLCG